ncbi:hypothetical protein [Dickeya dianthicola]|uniref:hypothetical protein n=1 Tax=Dickeya dianthicola TaxID=204039 RepID=UPI000CD4723E|nr:hypothetical protein [Dickeya dianthicola]MBI0437120.1 hypothetical protein [Dickeya dianthicola]MBI0448654.1 hypothetical protein [Dickeya dianthicola]MBI0452081.1 hypothetical protein [Dickeya dianthicola]MBI0456341.1 hypothetical protein [Dickeya dianthicola]MBI0460475.1 hypothetical protein [Dickeya dianthicola]
MIEAMRFFHASSLMELEQMMPGLIASGWQPYGALSVDPSLGGWDFYQAMIKGTAETTPPANQATVADGALVALYGSDGTTNTDFAVNAVVASNVITRVKLPSSVTALANAVSVAVRNSAGANSHNGASVITNAGVLTGINLPDTTAMIDNGGAVTVQTSAGVAVTGSHQAAVSAGVLQYLRLASTIAPINNGDAITMQNSAGTAIAGTHAATVTNGAISSVKLAATIAPVASGAVIASVPVTNNAILAIGTVNRQVTITVANGVPTGFTIV